MGAAARARNVDERIRDVIRSAELCLELAIINPSRYGALIHASVPDFVEILLKIGTDERGIALPNNPTFAQVVRGIRTALPTANQPAFSEITKYFFDNRTKFRNQIHHSAEAQGYNIHEREVLEPILGMDDFLALLFPTLTANGQVFVGSNFRAYMQFLRLHFDSLTKGRAAFARFSALERELDNWELRQKFNYPRDHKIGRVKAVQSLLPMDIDSFCGRVLGYPYALRKHIRDVLTQEPNLTIYQIQTRLKKNSLQPYKLNLVQNCLDDVLDEKCFGDNTVIRLMGNGYYLSIV